MAFTGELLSEAIRNAKPRRTTKDGNKLIYTFSEGYKITFKVFDNKVMDVSVYSPSWKGALC